MSENIQYLSFLNYWQQYVTILTIVAFALAAINYISFKLRYSSKKTLKEKFDLKSENESKSHFRTNVFIAVGLFLLLNAYSNETMKISMTWFFIRLFVAFCVGFLYAYVSYLILKFYFPGRQEKTLKKLRYTPRVNPENGNSMKLLSEEEEDAYLDEGMQAEENVFSVDYDVWIDEETGYTQIEKYKGHLTALECDRCGFQTLRLEKEEIIKEASDRADGELLKEYSCSYCGRIKRKTVILSHRIKDSITPTDDSVPHDGRIAVVKVEIHGTEGEIKEYDFQNLEQAKHFLDEFNFEKVLEETH